MSANPYAPGIARFSVMAYLPITITCRHRTAGPQRLRHNSTVAPDTEDKFGWVVCFYAADPVFSA